MLILTGILVGVAVGHAVTTTIVTKTIHYTMIEEQANYTVLVNQTNVNGTVTFLEVKPSSFYTEVYNITNNGDNNISVTASVGFVIDGPTLIWQPGPPTVTIPSHESRTITLSLTNFTVNGEITVTFTGIGL